MTSRILLLSIFYANIEESNFSLFFKKNVKFRASDLEDCLADFDDTYIIL